MKYLYFVSIYITSLGSQVGFIYIGHLMKMKMLNRFKPEFYYQCRAIGQTVIFRITGENMKDNSLPFLDCAVSLGRDGNLSIEVYRKPTHTEQYLLFDSHHPLKHELGVIWTLQDRAHPQTQRENRRK